MKTNVVEYFKEREKETLGKKKAEDELESKRRKRWEGSPDIDDQTLQRCQCQFSAHTLLLPDHVKLDCYQFAYKCKESHYLFLKQLFGWPTNCENTSSS